jgi:hypothetical protein
MHVRECRVCLPCLGENRFFAHPLRVLNDIFDPSKATSARPRKLGLWPQTVRVRPAGRFLSPRRVPKNIVRATPGTCGVGVNLDSYIPRRRGRAELEWRINLCGGWGETHIFAFPEAPASHEQVRAQAWLGRKDRCCNKARQTRPSPLPRARGSAAMLEKACYQYRQSCPARSCELGCRKK